MSHTPQVATIAEQNRRYSAEGFDASTPGAPSRQLAVVVCMDCRIDPYSALGLSNGEAHLMRNAGGVVTDDVIRSLCLSQRALGTREIVLVHHTDCGLGKVNEAEFRSELEAETGSAPTWSLDGFDDVHAAVRKSIDRLQRSPYIPHKDHITGYVYDVATGLLEAVESTGPG